ncbi:hypothetical protein CLOL250_00050 [Clostridium sp. L2-50]|nr:hypothetical protein CLOL250_00050 [Clostridium sp. L2-50]
MVEKNGANVYNIYYCKLGTFFTQIGYQSLYLCEIFTTGTIT